MQIHELKPKHKNRDKKRVGRGGKKGTYSGKGNKGQKSRAGRKMVPIIRELIKRYPKLRGYRSFVLEDYSAIVNLETLEKISKDGETINPENLIKKGIVSKIKGKTPKVKILGTGKLTKKLIVENCKTSKTAKEAIEKAGGTVKSLEK
ncbi:MAG: 50S ribosomal protein L15 [Candidatus Staskawiczbacteria bacterium]|jgi:large subunit ribosomal protein L15